MAADYKNALTWPVIAWVVVDVVFLGVKFVDGTAPFLDDVAVAVGLTLLFGIWAGLNIVGFGGKPLDVVAAGLIVGAVCAVGSVVDAYVHFPDAPTGGAILAIVSVSLVMNLFGAIIGGGYALSRPKPAPAMA